MLLTVAAQARNLSLPETRPESVGFSSERLKRLDAGTRAVVSMKSRWPSAARPARVLIYGTASPAPWFWIDPTNEVVFPGIIQRRGSPPGAPNIEDLSRQLTFQALVEPSR
jgi:hypothetical protein